MSQVNPLSATHSSLVHERIQVFSLLILNIKKIATAIFSKLASLFRAHPGESAGLKRQDQGATSRGLPIPKEEPLKVHLQTESLPAAPEVVRKSSEKDFSDIIPCLSSMYFTGEESGVSIWNLEEDARVIGSEIERVSLLEKYSQEELQSFLIEQIKNVDSTNSSHLRGILAFNKKLNLFDEMELLNRWMKKPGTEWNSAFQKGRRTLLVKTMQNGLLKSGWIKETERAPDMFNQLNICAQAFAELDNSGIEKYAKEFHSFFDYDKKDNLRQSLVIGAFLGRNENKLPIFLKSLQMEIGSKVIRTIFSGSFSEKTEKDCLQVLSTLDLSATAKGDLIRLLLFTDFEGDSKIRNECIENLLKQSSQIYFATRRIFLPVEKDVEMKKATIQLLLEMIQNSHIQHKMPVLWLSTLMAYLLDLNLSDAGQEDSAPFGKRWNSCVISKEALDLKEEDYEVLKALIAVLMSKPILNRELSLENSLPLLASVFLGLDKLRLSGMEHFKFQKDKKDWSDKTEGLMKKISNEIASRVIKCPMESQSIINYASYDPYTLVCFLFSERLNQEQVNAIFTGFNRVDPLMYPLVKSFFLAWSALDKGERIPLKST